MSVENPEVIDFVTQDDQGTVILVMVEGRQWDGSEERIVELENKINAYASFVFEGGLLSKYPHLVGKPVIFELRSTGLPDAKTAEFLKLVRDRLRTRDIGFEIRPIGLRPSG